MAERLTGLHAVEEAVRAGRRGILYVEKWNRRTSAIAEQAAGRGIEVVSCQRGEILKRTGLSTDTGVLFAISGVLRAVPGVLHAVPGVLHAVPGVLHAVPGARGSRVNRSFADALDSLRGREQTILFLDGITDPQNFGAILRCADQFRADLVVRQERRSAGETEAVARSSAGAVQYVEIVCVPNLSRAILEAKEREFWIFGADMGGEEVDRVDMRGKAAIVLGREGEGLHRLIRESCDRLVKIPTFGHIDSLNVSVSAGIILYEKRRQERAGQA